MLFASVLSAVSYVQPDTAWLFRYPGTKHRFHEPLTSFVDDTGNVYVAGWSKEGESRLDALLLKVDSLGHLVWTRTCDHVTAAGAARDKNGNLYIAGVTNDATVAGKICMLKYRPDGDTDWVRTYSEPGKSFSALGTIAIDDSQNVYACGVAESSSCFAVRVVKYTPDGVLSDVKRYTLCGYTYLLDGEFHVLGNGEAYLALSAENPDVDGDWVVVKLSADSRVLWDRVDKDTGSGWERLIWSQVDEDASIYLTGEVVSAVYGTEVFCTMKMDSSGKIRWTSEYLGPDSLRSRPRFLLLANGNVYVSGWNMCIKNGQDVAIAVLKYDSLGNRLWARQYGDKYTVSIPGNADENDEPTPGLNYCSMKVDDSGNVYLAGTGDDYPLTCHSLSFFAVLLKYDSRGNLVWARLFPECQAETWFGETIALDNRGALYSIGVENIEGSSLGIYVLKYRTR